MDNLKKILSWLTTFPFWVRALILFLTAGLVLVLTFTSCGVTKASVMNRAEGTTTEVKITTSNPTTVTATPNVNFSER